MHYFDDNRNRELQRLRENLRMLEQDAIEELIFQSLEFLGFEDPHFEEVDAVREPDDRHGGSGELIPGECYVAYEGQITSIYKVLNTSVLKTPNFLKELQNYESAGELADDIITGDEGFGFNNLVLSDGVELQAVEYNMSSDDIMRVRWNVKFKTPCSDDDYSDYGPFN